MTTINTQPSLFTPVNNPNIFQISSNNKDVVYWLVTVLSADNTVIANNKYYSLPNFKSINTAGTFFDLSSILSNVVDSEVINTSTVIEALPTTLISYKLNITEQLNEYEITIVNGLNLFSPTGKIIAGDTLTTGIYNVWSGGLNRMKFTGYDYKKYVITTSGGTQFLSNKPLINNVYPNSIEYLYLLNSSANYQIRFRFYGIGNVLLGTQLVLLGALKAMRLNVSPSSLDTYFGGGFNNIYGDEFSNVFTSPFGSYSDIYTANYYTVQIVSDTNVVKSELRTYIMRDSKSCRQSLQLLFSNQLCGFDSLDMFNPKESLSTTSTSIKNYGYRYKNGIYSNINNGVYNATSSIINSNTSSTYKAITDVLNDDSTKWLKSIISAEKVYLVLANGLCLPVTLSTNSFNIQSKRYSTNNNRLELEFTSDISGLFD